VGPVTAEAKCSNGAKLKATTLKDLLGYENDVNSEIIASALARMTRVCSPERVHLAN